MKVSIELDERSATRPLAIVADLLLLLGFAAVIYGLALYSLPLAFIVGGVLLFGVGVLLTVVTLGGKARPDRGPFDPGTAGRPQ